MPEWVAVKAFFSYRYTVTHSIALDGYGEKRADCEPEAGAMAGWRSFIALYLDGGPFVCP